MSDFHPWKILITRKVFVVRSVDTNLHGHTGQGRAGGVAPQQDQLVSLPAVQGALPGYISCESVSFATTSFIWNFL